VTSGQTPSSGVVACPAGNSSGVTCFNDGTRLTITGTQGPDTLVGTPGADELDGRKGNDNIDSGAGDDKVDGGAAMTTSPRVQETTCSWRDAMAAMTGLTPGRETT